MTRRFGKGGFASSGADGRSMGFHGGTAIMYVHSYREAAWVLLCCMIWEELGCGSTSSYDRIRERKRREGEGF